MGNLSIKWKRARLSCTVHPTPSTMPIISFSKWNLIKEGEMTKGAVIFSLRLFFALALTFPLTICPALICFLLCLFAETRGWWKRWATNKRMHCKVFLYSCSLAVDCVTFETLFYKINFYFQTDSPMGAFCINNLFYLLFLFIIQR